MRFFTHSRPHLINIGSERFSLTSSSINFNLKDVVIISLKLILQDAIFTHSRPDYANRSIQIKSLLWLKSFQTYMRQKSPGLKLKRTFVMLTAHILNQPWQLKSYLLKHTFISIYEYLSHLQGGKTISQIQLLIITFFSASPKYFSSQRSPMARFS